LQTAGTILTLLSVNVNKLATLRNSRGGNVPNVLQTTLDIERFGAQGITVHPRPDERHIRRQDVHDIKKAVHVELNVEGYPAPEFLDLIRQVRPAQVTLVPDPPDVLTSNAGWKVSTNHELLTRAIKEIKQSGARVSLFIDPKDYITHDMSDVVSVGADRIELYTEAYAHFYGTSDHDSTLALYVDAAHKARDAGLKVNAGHDLNTQNLKAFKDVIPFLAEVSIGHALICDALYWGLEETIHRYLKCLVE
jgi:pyridoxine 5-phosphate synthase